METTYKNSGSQRIWDWLQLKPTNETFTSVDVEKDLSPHGISKGAVTGFLHTMTVKGIIKKVGKTPGNMGKYRTLYRVADMVIDHEIRDSTKGSMPGRTFKSKQESDIKLKLPLVEKVDRKPQKLADQLRDLADKVEMLESMGVHNFSTDVLLTEIKNRTVE